MATTAIQNVEIMEDKSVAVFYFSGRARGYDSLEVAPKTVKAWLETHQPAADPDPIEEVVEEVIEVIDEVVEEPVVLAVVKDLPAVVPQVPTVVPEVIQEQEKPLLRGLVAMAPFVAAIGVINMLIVLVAGIGILAEIGECVELVLIELTQEAVERLRPVVRDLRVWWMESVKFRLEIILIDKYVEEAI